MRRPGKRVATGPISVVVNALNALLKLAEEGPRSRLFDLMGIGDGSRRQRVTHHETLEDIKSPTNGRDLSFGCHEPPHERSETDRSRVDDPPRILRNLCACWACRRVEHSLVEATITMGS